LSKLTKKTVVYNFRQNDLDNRGRGAPLTPIFHKLLVKKNKISLPVVILNIGGIANATYIGVENTIFAKDIGPGNCLIDKWIRLKSKNKNKYDKNGATARSGKINNKAVSKALIKWQEIDDVNYQAFDIKDFDMSFVKALSLKDGAATLTNYTSIILARALYFSAWGPLDTVIITGGGRKNKFLINSINKVRNRIYEEKIIIKLIEEFVDFDKPDYGINGDFIESQAFAYLAIRSYLNLPISFPETTGVCKPCSGGTIVKNF
jgi:anhydro-N-acetylmuramic acid kinase